MEYWIARDKRDNTLWLFNAKPMKNESLGVFTCIIKPDGEWSEDYELKSHLFPEVTFENSPQKIEIILKK